MSNNFIKISIAFVITIWIAQNLAFANIYKHVDENGNETFTNTPLQGSVLVFIESRQSKPPNPISYISEALAKSKKDNDLREMALKFIPLAYSSLKNTNTNITKKSLDTSIFKNEKYFKVTLNSLVSYNRLRVDRYAVGKELFDDAVKKIIGPLNDTVGNLKTIVGYDLIIYGYSKNFLDKYAKEQKIEYRFLIGSNVARRYKSKDISGQTMLDESVILMNDDRIELKLQ